MYYFISIYILKSIIKMVFLGNCYIGLLIVYYSQEVVMIDEFNNFI